MLETASKRISHAEGSSVLEAASRLVQGMAAACAEPCSLDVQQVMAGCRHVAAACCTALVMFCARLTLLRAVQLGALAKLLTRAKAAGSVQDACHVLAGLTALSTTGSLPKPVALELDTPTVPQGKVMLKALPAHADAWHALGTAR